jgi:hypothetical protein
MPPVTRARRSRGSRPHQPFSFVNEPGEYDRLRDNLAQIERIYSRADISTSTDAPSSPQQRRGSKKGGASPRNVKREVASASLSSPSSSSRIPSPGTVASAAPSRAVSPGDSDSSDSSHQPPPAAAIPRYQTFGPDPSTFDDPTIYHIREVNPGMSEEEVREIYSVAEYPHDDLHDLIPGTPPDRDFSSGKPTTNQVIQSTFAVAMEPYFRPLTEDDMAFLRERVSNIRSRLELSKLIKYREIESHHS